MAPTPEPPRPDVQSLVPSTAQVTGERFVQLTNSGPHQVVVTYVDEQQNANELTSRDLLFSRGTRMRSVGSMSSTDRRHNHLRHLVQQVRITQSSFRPALSQTWGTRQSPRQWEERTSPSGQA